MVVTLSSAGAPEVRRAASTFRECGAGFLKNVLRPSALSSRPMGERIAQLEAHLRAAGFEPLWRTDGEAVAGEDLARYGLVVLDLMLPGIPGLDLLSRIRRSSDVPVLILSARNDTPGKVRALQLGADDYMTKPFWPEELIERVRARLRRPRMERGDVLEAGPVRVDRARREVYVRDAKVELTRVEYSILEALAERPGAALTRRALAERALDPDRNGGERTLDVHVSRLRKKLGGDLVETVWGIGYRLVAGEGA
jgi:two-component system response regulator MtrA